MGFLQRLKEWFFPAAGGGVPPRKGKAAREARRRRVIEPRTDKEEHMSEHKKGGETYGGEYEGLSMSRDVMTPELVRSFNEFSQLLHNMNIKMAAQNDQNRALLRSLESLPAIIKDIPRARELEGDILQELLVLLRDAKEEKVRISERLADIKSAMIAMEENAKAQISFFEGKERAHRDQMNMMREFMERERRHHRNNLLVVSFLVVLFIAMLCGGAYVFLWERVNAFDLRVRMEKAGGSALAVPSPDAGPSAGGEKAATAPVEGTGAKEGNGKKNEGGKGTEAGKTEGGKPAPSGTGAATSTGKEGGTKRSGGGSSVKEEGAKEKVPFE